MLSKLCLAAVSKNSHLFSLFSPEKNNSTSQTRHLNIVPVNCSAPLGLFFASFPPFSLPPPPSLSPLLPIHWKIIIIVYDIASLFSQVISPSELLCTKIFTLLHVPKSNHRNHYVRWGNHSNLLYNRTCQTPWCTSVGEKKWFMDRGNWLLNILNVCPWAIQFLASWRFNLYLLKNRIRLLASLAYKISCEIQSAVSSLPWSLSSTS